MPTYVITKEQIAATEERIERIRKKAEEGDDLAELALGTLEYAMLLRIQLDKVTSLVLTQSNVLKLLIERVGEKIPLPDCPDDLVGYM